MIRTKPPLASSEPIPNNLRTDFLFRCLWNFCQDKPYEVYYKISLSKLKRIETLQSIFTDRNGIKLDINNNEVSWKTPDSWKSNNILLNNLRPKEETIRKIFKFLSRIIMKITLIFMNCS